MATQTTFSMRIDTKLKQRLQALAEELGISVSSLVTMQLRSIADPDRIQLQINGSWSEEFFSESISAEEFISALDD